VWAMTVREEASILSMAPQSGQAISKNGLD
jgi:hypothetical protein